MLPVLKYQSMATPVLAKWESVLLDEYYKIILSRFPEMDTLVNTHKKEIIKQLVGKEALACHASGEFHNCLDVPLEELLLINQKGVFIPNTVSIKLAEFHVAQECHAVSALGWCLNPKLKIYTGFSDRTHFHSWLLDEAENILWEPTPADRDVYFGHHVTDVELFVLTEVGNIERLYDAGKVTQENYAAFKEALARIIG